MKIIQCVCVCVDDFGIKYFNKDDTDHLLQSIGKYYQYTIDWKGINHYGLTLNWNYHEGYVEISIPGYMEKILKRLQCIPARVPRNFPHKHVPIKYGQKGTQQYITSPDYSPFLSKQETTHTTVRH